MKVVLNQLCCSTSFTGHIPLARFTVFAGNYISPETSWSDLLELCHISTTCQMVLSVGHEDNGNIKIPISANRGRFRKQKLLPAVDAFDQ